MADERGYSKASVHKAMERLADIGYVKFYQGKISLTKLGLIKAQDIEQKHKTLVAALKLIGVSDDSAEENACRMEHVITDDAASILKNHVERQLYIRQIETTEEP